MTPFQGVLLSGLKTLLLALTISCVAALVICFGLAPNMVYNSTDPQDLAMSRGIGLVLGGMMLFLPVTLAVTYLRVNMEAHRQWPQWLSHGVVALIGNILPYIAVGYLLV